MANPEHLAKLKEGVERWDQWRIQNPGIRPDLRGADLTGARLRGNLIKDRIDSKYKKTANFRETDFNGARLEGADLFWANLQGTDLSNADLTSAYCMMTDFSNANLSGAKLWRANLRGASLRGASLSEADLREAILVETNLEKANLTGCNVYGISVWNVCLEQAIQSNLVITKWDESPIQVDNLEVAQFIYLLLNNEKIRSVIDTITSKVVLILGRFTPERKVVLDAIRDELRKRDYLPVLFDFEKPASRNLTETVSTLAHMARFVIADITDAKSIPQELMAIVPNMPSVPVQPVLLASQQEYGMFEHFRNYPWVLEEVLYDDQQTLLAELSETVIAPAEAKAKELARK